MEQGTSGGRSSAWSLHTLPPSPLPPPPPHQLALKTALRYFPTDVQEVLAPEFAQELRLYGHIYMYRFCPDLEMR